MATPKLTPDQITQVSGLVAEYISQQQRKYAPRAMPLSAQQRSSIAPFFAPEPLGNTRLLVLGGERVPNPDFYPMLRSLGFKNLPDQSTMAAIVRGLSNLSPRERMVFELKHYHGLQLKTVAGILMTTEAPSRTPSSAPPTNSAYNSQSYGQRKELRSVLSPLHRCGEASLVP